MKAMVIDRIVQVQRYSQPLKPVELNDPKPAEKEILVEVSACGVCHTELDEAEGRTPPPHFPVIPGHQVVGRVAGMGPGASRFAVNDRVGISWIHSACGHCYFCLSGNENLCPEFTATGRDVNGGYAEYMTVSEDFAYPIPDVFTDVQTAPLLCAGAIGYRSLRLSGITDGSTLGLTGFGASGHLVLKLALHLYPDSNVLVFTRNKEERQFARELGATWTGDTEDEPPDKADAIIDTTPAWKPVVEALGNLKPGGRLVINAIRKEDTDKDYLLHLDYPKHLWMEKEIKSVANVTRKDVSDFLALAMELRLEPEIEEYPLEEAGQALIDLKLKKIRGAKVLKIRS